MTQINFFARRSHFIDHLAPIYNELGNRKGCFFIPVELEQYAIKLGIEPDILKPRMKNNPMEVAPPTVLGPLLVASVGDLQMAYLTGSRKIVLMEHGPGITFPGNSSYAGNMGYRKKALLTLAPNRFVFEKTRSVMPEANQAVIGTPMLDRYAGRFTDSRIIPVKPTIAIAFHWDGSRVAPEAGNAFRHYQSIIPELAKCPDLNLIAHGHPRNLEGYRGFYEKLGVEVVSDFHEVMDRAHLLINDCSSIAYMFLATGWPVILLNAPWFRKNVNFGLRFWDYTNIGEQVDNPNDLFNAISRTVSERYRLHINERFHALLNLFPFLGYSAATAVSILKKEFQGE